MTIQTVSFPGLGLEFNIDRVAFTIGGHPIYWYGIIIATGFLLAVLYMMKRAKTFGLDPDRVFDVIFAAIVLGIIGARLYFVAFSWADYKDDLWRIFDFRGGGLAIYGGVIFGVIGIWIASKIRKVRLLPMLDLAVGGVLIGQAIGRWGNFINVEAFGGNTSLPWGMTSPSIVAYLASQQESLAKIGMVVDPLQPVHPTFFYESMWCLIGFVIVALLTKKRRFDGELTLFYLSWYGLGRFFIEGLRTDSLMIGNIRVSQLVALICFLAGVISLIVIFAKIRREHDDNYLRLYVYSEEAEQIRQGTFYPVKEKKGKNREDSKTEEETTKATDSPEEEKENLEEQTEEDLLSTKESEDVENLDPSPLAETKEEDSSDEENH